MKVNLQDPAYLSTDYVSSIFKRAKAKRRRWKRRSQPKHLEPLYGRRKNPPMPVRRRRAPPIPVNGSSHSKMERRYASTIIQRNVRAYLARQLFMRLIFKRDRRIYEERFAAATKIQSQWRRRRAVFYAEHLRNVLHRTEDAVLIQRIYRGRIKGTRLFFERKAFVEQQLLERESATRIQKLTRRYLMWVHEDAAR